MVAQLGKIKQDEFDCFPQAYKQIADGHAKYPPYGCG
jgi:hypothetical protein